LLVIVGESAGKSNTRIPLAGCVRAAPPALCLFFPATQRFRAGLPLFRADALDFFFTGISYL
jgi:hypothetical protein